MMFRRRDPNVITEIRAETYPYGAGKPGHGVQITLERDTAPVTWPDEALLTLRLPRDDALTLAHWIIGTYQ